MSNVDRKVPQGLQPAFKGKGALLPSVAGCGALQPCVARLKQSIIIVGNKHQLPAKSWSALSVAGSFSYSANHFGSRDVEISLLSTHHIAGRSSESDWRIFGIRIVLYLFHQRSLFFYPTCDTVVIIVADRQ